MKGPNGLQELQSKLVLSNNLDSLNTSKAYADELGKKARFHALDRAKICLGLEEAILNVVTRSCDSDEKGTFEIVFRVTDSLFSIIVRIDGGPFDCENGPAADAATENNTDRYLDSGLGFEIIRSSFDQVIARDLPGGKELYLVKYLPLEDQHCSPETGSREWERDA